MNWILIISVANFCVVAAYTYDNSFATTNPMEVMKNADGGHVTNTPPTKESTVADDVMCTTLDDAAAARRSLCPDLCRCSPLDGEELLTKLTINCSGPEFNYTDSWFSSFRLNPLLWRCGSELTELTLTNTPFTDIGGVSFCKTFNKLRSLDLSRNALFSLPSNCFMHMPNLTTFAADYNYLSHLQDGVFTNLHQLKTLSLRRNFIRSIEPRVFDESANLSSLSTIDLSHNGLHELEPWPVIRAQHRPTFVDLSHNFIANFTNTLQWSYDCNSTSIIKLRVNFTSNSVKHLTDIYVAWNIAEHSLCLPLVKSTLLVDVRYNPLYCDCKDYPFFRASHYLPNSYWLQNALCYEPENLYEIYGLQNTLQLDRLVCNESRQCPPGCSCITRPYNNSLEISCLLATLDSLPHRLPYPKYRWFPSNYTYDLRFGGSNMKYLELRAYLVNTSRLDVRSSQIETITDEAWRSLQRIDWVDLSRNRLTTLPLFLQTENITFRSIALHGNPLSCGCDQSWLPVWLKSLGSCLRQPNSVLCHSPDWLKQRSILALNSDDFCQNPEPESVSFILKIVLPTVLSAVILVGACFIVIYCCRVNVFAKFSVHPFDVDECKNENMAFDAFVCCAWPDDDLARAIVDLLEGGNVENGDRGGYRVCYHSRDFPLGGVILRSIQQSIEHSKRVVCVLSGAFLDSEFCMLEFRAAWQWNIEHGRHRLIVVKCPGVDEALAAARRDTVADVNDVRMFLSTYTYIEHGSEDWWQKLLYAMPINRLPAVDPDSHHHLFTGTGNNNNGEKLDLADL